MRTDWQHKETSHSKCAIQGAWNERRAGSKIFSSESVFACAWRPVLHVRPGQHSWYSNALQAGQSGDQNPAGARMSPLVQTGPEAHPAPYTIRTGVPPTEIKRPERGATYFLSAGWYSGWSQPCISPRRLHKHIMGWHLPLLNYVGYIYCSCSAKLVHT